MANLISNKSQNIFHNISNSWTSVLYSVLLLSGSEIAISDWEKEFIIWLSEHDQNTVGLGVVGIDFENIRWNKTEFEDQREFVIKISDNAVENKIWKKLDYKPDEKILIDILNKWKSIFINADKADIKEINDYRWYIKPLKEDFVRKCRIHNVYLNKLHDSEKNCCLICNDM